MSTSTGKPLHATVTLAVLSALATLALLAAAPARGDVFGSITLLSASPFGQPEYIHDPALSADGRYVVFDGSVGGAPGVWRRRTEPGSPLEQVAGGDATLPSVSADGRYVSFTTNEGATLPAITDGRIQEGEPTREAPGVYVRDMQAEPAEPGAFTLASAKDHSALSLNYEFPGASEAELETKRTALGATAAGRSAITADGRTVVFVTTAQSDLAGPETPPLQVAVRHLDSEETDLVSVRYDPATGEAAIDPETGGTEPVEEFEQYGAVWSPFSPQAFSPHGSQLARGYTVPTLAGASISADGTAVAWLGERVAAQARTLPDEAPEMERNYAEPLWRRISGGPLEPTRRVTGGSDPESLACQASGERTLPRTPSSADPCQGPLATQDSGGFGTWNNHETANFVPQLSANGDEVAFIATAPLIGDVGGFGIGGNEYNSDVFWVDMTAPDHLASLRRLTRFASGEQNRVSTNANVNDLAISPDGQQVAFTTRRTVFPLGVPAFVSVPAAVPGLAELYDADLANETLTRVTRGYEGGAAAHPEIETGTEERYQRTADGALSPSFSQDGGELAFSSTASNLVFGDGNTPVLGESADFDDGADAFLVPRITFSSEPTPQTISPPPANPSPELPWALRVTAASLASGQVQIRATVPAAGTLAASATSALPAAAGRRSHSKVRRMVARATAAGAPDRTGLIKLYLKLSGHYRALADRARGLPGTVTVTFAAKGHPTLRRSLAIRFIHRVGGQNKRGSR